MARFVQLGMLHPLIASLVLATVGYCTGVDAPVFRSEVQVVLENYTALRILSKGEKI